MSLDHSGIAGTRALRVPSLLIKGLIVSGAALMLCGLSGLVVTGEDTDVVKAFANRQYAHLCGALGSACKTPIFQVHAGSEPATVENAVQFLASGSARLLTSIAFVLKECLNTLTVLGIIAFAMAGLLDAYNANHPRPAQREPRRRSRDRLVL